MAFSGEKIRKNPESREFHINFDPDRESLKNPNPGEENFEGTKIQDFFRNLKILIAHPAPGDICISKILILHRVPRFCLKKSYPEATFPFKLKSIKKKNVKFLFNP